LKAISDADALNLQKHLVADADMGQLRAAADERYAAFLKGLEAKDRETFERRRNHALAWQSAFEKQDWAALYQLAGQIEEGWMRGTALRLALLPELGREADAPKVLEELRARVASEPVMCGKAVGELILAERPRDALDLAREYQRFNAARILMADLRFRDGFAEVAIKLPLRDPDSWIDNLRPYHAKDARDDIALARRIWDLSFLAHTVKRLGEEEIGVRLLGKAAELAEMEPQRTQLGFIVGQELAFGLADRAWRHIALAVKDKKPDERNAALCWTNREAAGVWWDFLNNTEQLDGRVEEIAKTIVSLLEPKKTKALSASEARSLIVRLRDHAVTLALDEQAAALQVAAETADIQQLVDLSHEIWKELESRKPSGKSALALADYYAAKERWDDAASSYREAWSRDRKLLFTLILQAKSLEKLGRHDEAEQVRLLAQLWPTGNDDERMQIPFRLQGRGQMEQANEQYAVAGRFVQYPRSSIWIVQSLAEQQVASAPGAAAEGWKLVRLLCFGDGIMMHGDETDGQYSGEEETVQRIHHLKATSLIDAKDFDGAIKEALAAEAAQPAGTKMAMELVKFFDEAGANELADRVFEKIWSRRKSVVDDFPNAAEFHEQLAMIGTTCKRKLDECVAHAEAAVRLRPRNVLSHLSLARVHFARGEKQASKKAVAEALALDPVSIDAEKLRRQLEVEPGSR
jgi:hypothetical protein